VDALKGEVAFIRKTAGITKSTRGVKSAREPETIPHSERRFFLIEEDQKKTFGRSLTVWENRLLRANTQLSSPAGVFRRTLDNSLQ
jgi:hypothetical protein